MAQNKSDESPNTNCIEGWQCPECKSWGPFVVQATVWVQVHDDGTEPAPDYGGTEYDNASLAACTRCGKHATVRDFR